MSYQETGVPDPAAEDTFKQVPYDQLTDASSQQVNTEDEPGSQAYNFKALRSEIQEKNLKIEEIERKNAEEREFFQRQLEELKAHSYKQEQTKNQSSDDYFSNLDPDYLPSVGEIKNEFQKFGSGLRTQLEELQMMQKHPDYGEVLQNNLVPLLKEKPYLADLINKSSNKAQAAYDLAILARQSKPSEPELSGPDRAQRIVENSRKVTTAAYAGGQSYIDKADYYAQMSDADFMKIAKQNLDAI